MDDLDLPERFEVLNGEIIEMPPPKWRHTAISNRIHKALMMWLLSNPIGDAFSEGGYVFSESPLTTLVPDVSFIRNEQIPDDDVDDQASDDWLRTPPELVVEVVSPSDRASRVNKKVLAYLERGVKLIWIVDPSSRTVTIHAAARPGMSRILYIGETLDGEDVLPGFSFPLSSVFSRSPK